MKREKRGLLTDISAQLLIDIDENAGIVRLVRAREPDRRRPGSSTSANVDLEVPVNNIFLS